MPRSVSCAVSCLALPIIFHHLGGVGWIHRRLDWLGLYDEKERKTSWHDVIRGFDFAPRSFLVSLRFFSFNRREERKRRNVDGDRKEG